MSVLALYMNVYSQKPTRVTRVPGVIVTEIQKQAVVLYEQAGFAGQTKSLTPGVYLLSDFNDLASSIKVPAGMVAVIYEHATPTQGYGIWVDLLEDCADLSIYNFNDKVSYVNVFYASKDNLYDWARNAMRDGQFIPGHWERKRAVPVTTGPNTVAVVAPPIAAPLPTSPSVLAVNGASTIINSLGIQTPEGRGLWERAMTDQLNVIGNDFHGPEEIGSAAFERESHNTFIPDFFNFWYPQKQPNDHRSLVYFKRTLAGTVREARQVNIEGTYQDYDVNIDIVPDPKYMYLIRDGHPREYTDLMSRQWTLSAHQSGKPDCDDAVAAFERVECEIAEDYWPQGDHTFGRAFLADLALVRTGKKMCVYGPWIYDAGHCCQPEIHPAEELWWSEPQGNSRKFNLNVMGDASRRFLWRKNMDDGTKLKPWGEPPIKGLFAIAFEYNLNNGADAAIGYTNKKFEVANLHHYNVIEYPGADQTYHLVYNGKNIVSFIPHNNAFKVSFEHVGIAPDAPDKIRGFLVIETSVGITTQIATAITVFNGNTPQVIRLPANSTPAQAPVLYENRFFKKEAGYYQFTVTETDTRTGKPDTRVIN